MLAIILPPADDAVRIRARKAGFKEVTLLIRQADLKGRSPSYVRYRTEHELRTEIGAIYFTITDH